MQDISNRENINLQRVCVKDTPLQIKVYVILEQSVLEYETLTMFLNLTHADAPCKDKKRCYRFTNRDMLEFIGLQEFRVTQKNWAEVINCTSIKGYLTYDQNMTSFELSYLHEKQYCVMIFDSDAAKRFDRNLEESALHKMEGDDKINVRFSIWIEGLDPNMIPEKY